MNNIEPETVRTVSAEQSNIITSLLVPDKAEQLVVQMYKIYSILGHICQQKKLLECAPNSLFRSLF